MADWSLLPIDLLQSIAKFIESHFDFLRFRRVCTTWRSSAPLNLRSPPIFSTHFHFHTDESVLCQLIWKRTVFLLQFPSDSKTPKSWLVRLDEDEFGKKRFFNPLYCGNSFLMAEEFAVNPFEGIWSVPGIKMVLEAEEEKPTVGGMFVSGRRFKYLVELCGNLLLVEVELTSKNVTASALRCEVFQLDEERKRWDNVVSLGDAILFVGKCCKFSVPVVAGVEGSCVVFVFREGFEQDKSSELQKTFVFQLSSGVVVPLDRRPDLLQLFCPPTSFQ